MRVNPGFAATALFTRITENAYGDATSADIGQSEVVVALNKASAAAGDAGGSAQVGAVFVPRGTDRREGDRFGYNGHVYELIGHARGDQDQPFTGDDLGWMSFGIKRLP
jgi:hypothetical protein